MDNIANKKSPWVERYRPEGSNLIIKTRANSSLEGAQAAHIQKAFDDAVKMVSKGLETLQNYDENSPERVKWLLEVLFSSNFLDGNDNPLTDLTIAMDQMKDGLEEEVTIKVFDRSTIPGSAGYVNFRPVGYKAPKQTDQLVFTPISKMVRKQVESVAGNIHLSTGLLINQPVAQATKSIIHEAAHRYAGAIDHHYLLRWKAHRNILAFRYMDPVDAVRNADSIARFCQYLATPGLEAKHPIVVMNKPGPGRRWFCTPEAEEKLQALLAAKQKGKQDPDGLGPC